jgi:hypothetical protein
MLSGSANLKIASDALEFHRVACATREKTVSVNPYPDRWRGVIATAAAVGMAVACSRTPRLDLTVSLERVEGGSFASAPLRLYKDGRLVASSPDPREDLPIGTWRATDPVPAFRVQMDLPCGPKDLPIEVGGLLRERDLDPLGLPKRPQTVKRYLIRPKRPAGLTFRLWIDNRGGSKRAVGIGKFTFEVGEGASIAAWSAPVPECVEGAALTLDGQAVASMPLELQQDPKSYTWSSADPERHSRNFLLDTSGARCYEFRWVLYTEAGYQPKRWIGDGGSVFAYRRKFLHRLTPHEVRHFLEAAPERLSVSRMPLPQGALDREWAHMSSRTQLTEARCR